ncbi:MAG: isocitrate lyase/phosphoenolpyruvate mutase family protein, partial [Myxococcota bacterium]
MPSASVTAPRPGRVRSLIDAQGTIIFPGVYDAVSAKLAEQAGFDLLFISGYSVSASRLGEPDFGLVTQSEMADA